MSKYIRNYGKRWTYREVMHATLLYYNGTPLRIIALKLARPERSIISKLKDIGVTVHFPDTPYNFKR